MKPSNDGTPVNCQLCHLFKVGLCQSCHFSLGVDVQFPRRPRPEPAPPVRALGAFCARHTVWVIAAWLVLPAGAFLGRHAVGPAYSDEISLPSTRSRTVSPLLTTALSGITTLRNSRRWGGRQCHPRRHRGAARARAERMFLMGGANGRLPRALDRILPHPRLHADVAPEPRPAPVSASSSAPAG